MVRLIITVMHQNIFKPNLDVKFKEEFLQALELVFQTISSGHILVM